MPTRILKGTIPALLIAVVLMVVSILPVFATGPLKSKNANRFDTSITLSTSSAKVTANVKAASSVSKITIKMELQKKNGTIYQTVKTWSTTVNSSSASMQKNAVVSSKATYRVRTTFTVYTGNNSETITKYAY